jgi:hypothetical protein
MANNSCAPYTGPSIIDVTAIRAKLVDLVNGELQGFQREKPGLVDVLDELTKGVAQYGETLGVHPGVHKGILEKTQLIADIRALKLEVNKLAEVLAESEVYYESSREADISRLGAFIASTVQHGDPSVAAAFHKTLKYRGQYAEKALATRRKNKQPGADADAKGDTDAPSPA